MSRFPKQAGVSKLTRLVLFYFLLRHLPPSATPFLGKYCRKWRYWCCRGIFKFCGRNVNIEHGASFSNGLSLEIGDNSGIGIHCSVPPDTIIGDNVMMGPDCYILAKNHNFTRVDIPMIDQDYFPSKQTVIGNDCWIGEGVLFTPGRKVSDGTIVAARTVLTKDFASYSIIGGNPAQFIRSRS